FVEELAWALHASGARLALVVPPQVTDPAAAAAPDPLADPGGWLQARAASFDYRALAVYADLFIVDTRDYAVRPRIRRDAAGRLHVLGGPGAVAPQGWLESVIDHALLHVPARRLVLTLPLYGRAWPAGGQDADPDPGGAGDAAGRLVPLADAGRLLEGAQAVEEQPDRASGGRRVAWTDAGGRPWVLYIDDAPSLEAKAGLVARHDLGGLAFWRLGFGTPQDRDAAGGLVPLADAGRLLEGAQAVEEQPDRASGGRRVAWTDAGGRPWVLYIDDAPSLEAKAGLVARHDLGGLAFWRLGFGTP